jgi:hypothetical protein
MVRALNLLHQHEHTFDLLIEDRLAMEQVPAILPAVLSGKAFKYIVVF